MACEALAVKAEAAMVCGGIIAKAEGSDSLWAAHRGF